MHEASRLGCKDLNVIVESTRSAQRAPDDEPCQEAAEEQKGQSAGEDDCEGRVERQEQEEAGDSQEVVVHGNTFLRDLYLGISETEPIADLKQHGVFLR